MADFLAEVLLNFKEPHTAAAVSAIGTVLAGFASIISVGIATFALVSQRRHDRKSVLPILQIVFGDYETELYVTIENAGIGPAIITGVKVRNKKTGVVRESIIEFMPDLPEGISWETFIRAIKGRAIAAHGELVILKYSVPVDHGTTIIVKAYADAVASIRTALGDLVIELDVADAYGDRLPRYSRDLEWFHRHERNDGI